MTCDLEKKYIYIYKGDDTNWNNEQFLTVNVTSEAVDLSTMTAKFILGSYTKTFPLTTGSFQIDLTHAVTGTYAYGPINGVIQILDSEQRIKTVSNTIPFYITNKVIAAQDETYNVEVPEGSPIDINIDIGFGEVKWGIIAGNINDQLDLKAALYSKVSKIGDTMTGNLVMDNAAVDFVNFKVETANGLAKIGGQQYGMYIDPTTGEGAVLTTANGAGKVLTSLDIKDTYSSSSTDPISGQGVSQAISTKQDTLTAAQLTAVNSGIDSAKVAQIATNAQNITNEATARENADNGLQTQIDALSASSDVKDIVGTYAELQNYDTSTLGNNDIIKVLNDSTHEGAPSYYRWSTATQTFTYIGSESASYTKAQADAKFETITDAAQTYATKSELTTGLATKASTADGTTIVDNGTNISTVAVKEQNNALAIKEWVGTKAEYEALEELDPNTLYTITDEADVTPIVVDSTLSPTSTNAIQNKAVYDALQNVDSLPSQTGHAGEYLTTDGTNASWGAVAGGGIEYETQQSGAIVLGGYNATTTAPRGGMGTILLGNGASARDNNSSYASVVVGYTAKGGNGSVSIGRSANNSTYDKTFNVGIGYYATANNYAVALGTYTTAYNNGVAIGSGASTSNRTNANGDGAIAIGHTAVANGAGTIQIGAGTNSNAGTVQIGQYPLLDATGTIFSARLPAGGSGADTSLSNLSDTGKITAAHLAMPSSTTYEDLTLGTSGDSYYAPADGYVVFCKDMGGSANYISVTAIGSGIADSKSAPAHNWPSVYVPVTAGEEFQVYYSGTGEVSVFRFVYAVGSESVYVAP